jgi:hypothetical protein
MRIDMRSQARCDYHVYLNGKRVRYALMADDEKGEVEAVLLDERGYFLRDPDTGEPITEIRHGQVELRPINS